jgi:hypothetical protein
MERRGKNELAWWNCSRVSFRLSWGSFGYCMVLKKAREVKGMTSKIIVRIINMKVMFLEGWNDNKLVLRFKENPKTFFQRYGMTLKKVGKE